MTINIPFQFIVLIPMFLIAAGIPIGYLIRKYQERKINQMYYDWGREKGREEKQGETEVIAYRAYKLGWDLAKADENNHKGVIAYPKFLYEFKDHL